MKRSRFTGHSSQDVGDKYGMGYSWPVLAIAVAKLETPTHAGQQERERSDAPLLA